MIIRNLKKPEMWARYLAKLKKRYWIFSSKHQKTTPIFVAGLQRSGTTMLMNVFHLHPEVEVYDESHNSKVFKDFRVRSLQIVDDTLKQSYFPFVCYKIICDSHILNSFIEAFPEAKIVWVYRDAADNAESRLRKFPQGTRAIRLVAQNKPGGGWFADGVNPKIAKTVREVYSQDLSEFDFACLHWWVRNSLFFELGLDSIANVRILQYEELAQNPRMVMSKLLDWLDLKWSESAFRFVHARSVGKTDLPELHPEIKVLCEELKEKLDREYKKDWY